MPPESGQSLSGRAPRSKSVLFCPRCWHESPVDGDWQVQATPAGESINCPVCDATVTGRPDASNTSVTGDSNASAGSSFVSRLRSSFVCQRLGCMLPAVTRRVADRLRATARRRTRGGSNRCHP